MPEFFLELFSEEIPARMQARAAGELQGLVRLFLEKIVPADAPVTEYYGPRRIAISTIVLSEVPATTTSVRGPRLNAPEQALAGFLRKNLATKEQLRSEGDYYVLDVATISNPAFCTSVLASAGANSWDFTCSSRDRDSWSFHIPSMTTRTPPGFNAEITWFNIASWAAIS